MKRVIFRPVCVTLIHVLVASSVPVQAAPEPPSAPAPVLAPAPAPPPPPPVVNRSVPAMPAPPLRPSFSVWPSEREITRARIFEEPLVPAQSTSRRENRALAQALNRYLDARSREDVSALEGFLAAHPASPWRTSLLTNLGLVAQQTGYFTKALEHYEEAWRLGKDAPEPRTRAIAQRAASELAWLLTGLGHDERLAELLKEVEGRPFSGSSDERVRMARQGLWLMQNRPEEAFRCGPVALSNLLLAMGHANVEEIAHTPGSARGTSLTQMRKLAASNGVSLQMARRQDRGAGFPTPAMIHLKTGHFAALLERSGDRYRIADPVFRQEHWISTAALDAESSGYVLLTDLPAGFQPVDDAEGDEVWGRSCPNGPDPTQPCPTTGGGSCGKSGSCPMMADYTFLALHAALRIVDTPLQYKPPKGPSVNFTLTYNQKEIFQPAVFSYFNVGPKWTFAAVSYVIDDPSTTAPHTVKVYLRGGGMEIYPSLPSSGWSLPEFRTRAQLARIGPGHYVRRLPDGSSETFSQPDGGLSFPRKVFLTEEVDPQGNKLSFVYSDSLQLTAIVDALGQVTSFSYADEESRTITRMTDPFGRTANLAYDAQGRLSAITDSLGLTSSFTYGEGDFITALTTPYGTTTFSTGNNGVRMWVEAEDPVGGRERAEYVIPHDSTIGPRVLPLSEVPVAFRPFNYNFDASLTLFWDKRAMALAPNQLSSAEITHWLEEPGTHLPRGVARARKQPLEARQWFEYEGQFTSHGADGRLKTEGRLLGAGPPEVVQITRYTRNKAGKVCTMIDPVGRETRYVYGTGTTPDDSCILGLGIDLLETRQTNGGGYDVVQRGTYNAGHQPLTLTDESGQTTAYTYNAAGQLLTVTTPPRAGFPPSEDRTTTYTYDPVTGYLQRIVRPGSVTTTYTYDGYGRMRTITSNDGDTTIHDYDLFDRPTRVTHADATYEETAYDRLDIHRTRDRQGRWSETFYDPLRRVVSRRDPEGRVSRQEWCVCGSLERVVNANGGVTRWEYDLQGRRTRKFRPGSTAERPSMQYFYESATSRLARTVDGELQEIHYTYAPDDLVTRTSFVNAHHPTPTVTLDYTDPATSQPDAHRRVRSMTDGTGVGSTRYEYHPFGQLGGGRLRRVDGSYGGDDIDYTYDEWGRVDSRTYEGQTTRWRYDLQGRLETLTDPIGEFRFAYVGNTERLDRVTYPNLQTSVYGYHGPESDRLLSQIEHRRPGGALLNMFQQTYDDAGNVKTWTQQTDTDPVAAYTFEYDRANQLVAATLAPPGGAAPPTRRQRYAYDPAGNRTADQLDDAVTAAFHDQANRLFSHGPGGTLAFRGTVNEPATVKVAGQPATVATDNSFAGQAVVPGGPSLVTIEARDSSNNLRTTTYQVTANGASRSFVHDANGNLVSRTESGVTTTYEWDGAQRLVTVKRGATLLAAYTYDGRGRRATKTAVPEGVTYVWDEAQVVQERSTLFPNRRYVRGLGIDNQLAVVEDLGNPTYLVSDHLGSVVRVTNSAGTPTLTRRYDPWGNLLQGGTTNGYAFTGREWDSEAGLYYYRARFYDPGLGRFLGEDLRRQSGAPNEYAYVANRPATQVDPTGHDDVDPSFGPCMAAARTEEAVCQSRGNGPNDLDQLEMCAAQRAAREAACKADVKGLTDFGKCILKIAAKGKLGKDPMDPLKCACDNINGFRDQFPGPCLVCDNL